MSHGISGRIFGLITSFLSNRRLRVVLNGKPSQEYPVNAGVPQGYILGPTLFLLDINDLPDDVICNIGIYADDTTPFECCGRIYASSIFAMSNHRVFSRTTEDVYMRNVL